MQWSIMCQIHIVHFDNVPIHRNIYIFLNKATARITDFQIVLFVHLMSLSNKIKETQIFQYIQKDRNY